MNHLSYFALDNFKAFQTKCEFDLKPITFLIGKNSSGKSSLTKGIRLCQNLHLPYIMDKSFQKSKIGNFDSVKNLTGNKDDIEISLPYYIIGILTPFLLTVVLKKGKNEMITISKIKLCLKTSRKLKEVDDAYREIAEMIATEQDSELGYAAIVIDETQDFGPQALKLFRAMIPHGLNDLFFVGDGHQRIYTRNRAAMSRCGIDIRGRSRKLYLNYRTTDEIRRLAVALLEGCEIDDLDDGPDENKRYKSLSHGPTPEVRRTSGLEDAAAASIDFIKKWRSEEGERDSLSFCVVTYSEKSRDSLGQQPQSVGIASVPITAQSNHPDVRYVVHLATMHRAKGLEFDCVIVVAPESYLGNIEETSYQRRLLYVALTRAKRGAVLFEI